MMKTIISLGLRYGVSLRPLSHKVIMAPVV